MNKFYTTSKGVDQPIIGGINAYIHACRVKNDGFVIEVKPIKSKRSYEQNAWYWGVLIPAFERQGYSKDDAHDMLKSQFLSYTKKVNMPVPFCPECGLYFNKEVETCPKCKKIVATKIVPVDINLSKSTAELSVDEFSKYLEQGKEYLKECGGYLTTDEYNKYIRL